MSETSDRPLRRWRGLAALAAVSTFALIVFGGIVRITGSGMGCGDDWPLCNGKLIPPLDFATMIEYGHRLAAAAVALLVAGLVVQAVRHARGGAAPWREIRRLSLGAGLLLAVQVMLGAVTVWLELPALSVILHLGTAMLLLAVLIAGWSAAGWPTRATAPRQPFGLGVWTAGFGFAVVLAGALVANLDAAPACQGFPLCNGTWRPAANPAVQVHWGHRLLAYALVAWCLALPFLAARRRPGDRRLRVAAVTAAALALAQLVVGAAMVLGGLPTALRATHVALGAAVFVTLVAFAWLGRRPGAVPETAAGARRGFAGREATAEA